MFLQLFIEKFSKTFLYLIKGLAGPFPDNQVVIVGGGLAGLAASLSLSKAGFEVVLLEAANYLGRLIALTFSVL